MKAQTTVSRSNGREVNTPKGPFGDPKHSMAGKQSIRGTKGKNKLQEKKRGRNSGPDAS